MAKRVAFGVVTSDRMSKTRRVEIRRKVRHPLYGKYVAQRTICYAHDENNESGEGDTVEIIESRPLSKKKRWRLVRVIAKSTTVDVAALRAARKAEEEAEAQAELVAGARRAQAKDEENEQAPSASQAQASEQQS